MKMGQRLNIEITQGERLLANSYYHWAAYTSSSIEMTMHILKEIKDDAKTPMQKAVHLLQVTGAGFNDYEMMQAKENTELSCIELKSTEGRNDGLLSISEKGMKETRRWEEGRVAIDIENKMIDFRVYSDCSEEELKEDYPEFKIVNLDIDIEKIPFDKFDEFSELFKWESGNEKVYKINGIEKYIIPIE